MFANSKNALAEPVSTAPFVRNVTALCLSFHFYQMVVIMASKVFPARGSGTVRASAPPGMPATVTCLWYAGSLKALIGNTEG